jgi:GAF domain-containing protein
MELAALAYVLRFSVRSYRRERNQAALPLAVAMGFFFVSVANDVAVGIGLYKFVYTVEYGYLSLILLMAYMLSNAIEQALSTAQQRERELAEATRQARQAAQAEQQVREREEQVARQLRQAVYEYSTFLERVTAGDYSARLVLDEATQTGEGASDLVKLGHHLNSTVESLVTALSELQTVQRHYVRETWASCAASGAVQRGFRYQAAKVRSADDAWLPPMSKAVQEKKLTTSKGELALPITLRGEVIGAIGARREEQTRWSDDDIALAQAITDQLAQTIEGLRLLDETQRRAARERILREISDRMQRAADMEALMHITAEELNKALGGSRAYVRLGIEALQPPNGNEQR